VDGSHTVPQPGDWSGVTLHGTGQLKLNDFVDIRYWQSTHAGAIGDSETWDGTFLHEVTGTVTIGAGETLTIRPGAIVKFHPNTSIVVEENGRIEAQGVAGLPITFTSIRDDSVGGDTNGDDDATTPYMGDWIGIKVRGLEGTFDHVDILYAGGSANNTWNTSAAAISTAGNPTVTISHSTILDPLFEGVINWGGDVTITNTVIAGADRGVNADGDTVRLVNCTLDNNRIGIWEHGAETEIINTIISNSHDVGIQAIFTTPTVRHSNVWSATGANYAGMPNPSGTNDNISADPQYLSSGSGNTSVGTPFVYELGQTSPNLDAADGTDAPLSDKQGNARFNDFSVPDTGSGAITYADIGAFERWYAGTNVDLLCTKLDAVTLPDGRIQFDAVIENQGTEDAAAGGVNHFYLRPDGPISQRSSEAYWVGASPPMDTLEAGQGVQVSVTLPVLAVPSGEYNPLIYVDADYAILEIPPDGESNNGFFMMDAVEVDLPDLVLGTPVVGDWSVNGNDLAYDIEIPGGSRVKVTLTSPQHPADAYFSYYGLPDDFESDYHATVVVVYEEGDFATATFDLTSIEPGVFCDVVAIWPDRGEVMLADAFTVVEGVVDFDVDLIGPDIVRPGSPMPYTVQWTNLGNVDLPAHYVGVEFPEGVRVTSSPYDKEQLGHLELLAFTTISDDYAAVPPGASGEFEIWLTFEPGQSLYDVSMDWLPVDDPLLAETAVPWDDWIGDIKPPDMDAEDWHATVDSVAASLGNDWSDVLSNMVEDDAQDSLTRGLKRGMVRYRGRRVRVEGTLLSQLMANQLAEGYDRVGADGVGVHRNWVVIVGIDDYSNTRKWPSQQEDNQSDQRGLVRKTIRAFSDLPGVTRDAVQLADFLAKYLSIPTSQFVAQVDLTRNDADDIDVLSKIESAWNAAANRADGDDKIMFFYAGHGCRPAGGDQIQVPRTDAGVYAQFAVSRGLKRVKKLCISQLPWWAQQTWSFEGALVLNYKTGFHSPDSYVTGSELRQIIESNPTSAEKFIFLDACHSEAIGVPLNGIPNLKWTASVAANELAIDWPTSFTSMWIKESKYSRNDSDKDGRVTLPEAFKGAKRRYNRRYGLHPKDGGDANVDQELNDNLGEAPKELERKVPRDCKCRYRGLKRKLVCKGRGLARVKVCKRTRGIMVVTSMDPNEKVGPEGYGPQHHIVPGTMSYSVYFENDPDEATAPAQVVTITDQLDTNLDWSTFQLGQVVFGNTTVALEGTPTHGFARVEVLELGVLVDIEAVLDAHTGVVTWTFQTLDPLTFEPTEDPLAGFLPPNTEAPLGEGYVTYTISPKEDVVTGDTITNAATIIFDTNDPIVTDEVFNTIDDGAPISQINPLPAYSPPTFQVSWTGQDEDGAGSGIAYYDIYASTDGGPCQSWLDGTPDTSAEFTGEYGHTYAFCSVATDNVGHHEESPTPSQSQTTVRGMDLGDAPLAADSGFVADYPTQLSNNGARHVIVDGSPFLGTMAPDAETNGQPDAGAAGDDNDADDDEDGVEFTTTLIPGNQVDASVTVTGAGYLNAWIDFNADGDWDDTDEQIITDLWLETGTFQPDFDVPYDATIGQTYARFRYSTTAGLAPTGRADDGEVEDDVANVIPAGSISGYVYADVNDNGIREDHELVLPNVPVTLEGPVNDTVTTDTDGRYVFANLPNGMYTVIETQPLAFNDGKDTQGTPALGTVGDDRFVDIQLAGATEATDYNFGERGLIGELVTLNFRQNNAPSPQEFMAQLDVMTGEWYAFQAPANGTFNAHAEAEGVGLELYTADLMPVAIGGTGELSVPVAEGESYVLHVAGDAQAVNVALVIEEIMRQYLTNPDNALDVTGDGYVSPLDVLAIISELDHAGSLATSATGYFCDVNGDGRATSLDVLTVINHLNTNLPGGGEDEPVVGRIGNPSYKDVGWDEPVKAHQNTFAISSDAHLTEWTAQSGGPASLGPPYEALLRRGLPTTPPTGPQVSTLAATGGVGRPAPSADSVRHSLTYDEVEPVLAELDSILPAILADVDNITHGETGIVGPSPL